MNKPLTHWSHDNPGLADQYRAEALAARRSLGFDQGACDVAPADITAAIEALTRPSDAPLLKAFDAGRRVQEEIHRLRSWIKGMSNDYDICTYNVLKEICDDCRCGR